MSKDINAETFDQEVVQANIPVLVDFWGPSCGPCLALAPSVEKMETNYGGKFKLVKIDASKNRRFCLTHKIIGLPTFLIYKNGQEVERLTGSGLNIEKIEEAVKKVLD